MLVFLVLAACWPAALADVQWARRVGDAGMQSGLAVAAAQSANATFLGGLFFSQADFGDGQPFASPSSSSDGFVARYDGADGAGLVWKTELNGTGDDFVTALALAPSEAALFVGGAAQGAASLGAAQSEGAGTAAEWLVARLDAADGSADWLVRREDERRAVALAPAGDAAVAVGSPAGVELLDAADGSSLWTLDVTDGSVQGVWASASVVVAAGVALALDNDTVVVSEHEPEAFVAVLSAADGAVESLLPLGAGEATGVACLSAEQCFVSGWAPTGAGSNTEGRVWAVNSSWTDLLWSAGTQGASVNALWGVAVSPSGDVFVAGQAQGTVDFEGVELDASPGYNLLLARLAAEDGALHWAQNAPLSYGYDVAVDALGRPVVAGELQGSLGDISAFSDLYYDAFVAAVAVEGSSGSLSSDPGSSSGGDDDDDNLPPPLDDDGGTPGGGGEDQGDSDSGSWVPYVVITLVVTAILLFCVLRVYWQMRREAAAESLAGLEDNGGAAADRPSGDVEMSRRDSEGLVATRSDDLDEISLS